MLGSEGKKQYLLYCGTQSQQIYSIWTTLTTPIMLNKLMSR